MPINRRRALLALGSTSAIPIFGGSKPAPATGVRFDHGVASGDPLIDRVILWTRVSGLSKATEVTWQVATDVSFGKPVAQGRFTTDAERDYTVKVDATGLKPGTDYVYRFTCKGVTSPVGRTRTLPEQTEELVLASPRARSIPMAISMPIAPSPTWIVLMPSCTLATISTNMAPGPTTMAWAMAALWAARQSRSMRS